MTDALRAARSAWPGVELAEETFAAYLAQRAIDSGSPHLDDLFLACACEQHVDAALRAFETAIMSQLSGILARLRPNRAFIEDVGQMLREKLFVGAEPKICEYSGKGKLLSWFRVVAVRAAIDLKRTRGELMEQLDPHRSIAGSATTPELEALRNRYRPLFKSAFATALGALTSEQRSLLRLHYADGLTMEELGRMFTVNRSTIFRRLNDCMQQLLKSMREGLGAQLGLTTAEFESLADVMQSDLQLSLSGLLDVEG